MLKFSDVPIPLIPEGHVNRPLELRSAIDLPYNFRGILVQPVTFGVLSLLEACGNQAFKNTCIDDIHSFAMMLYIINNREKASELVLSWRDYQDVHLEEPAYPQNILTSPQHSYALDMNFIENKEFLELTTELDRAVIEFASSTCIEHLTFTEDDLVGLWEYIYSTFNGKAMLPGAKGGKTPAYLYDAYEISSAIVSACKNMNVSYFEALWRVPATLAIHADTAAAAMDGTKHIGRPPNIEFLKKFQERIAKRELKGEINHFQLREPMFYELSPAQIDSGGDHLVIKYGKLKARSQKMNKEQRQKHFKKYSEIIQMERTEILKEIEEELCQD